MLKSEEQSNPVEGWVILELMGHRRLTGYLQEQQIGGASFLRLDVVPEEGDALATQYYSPSAVYCITPTTEVLAKAFARRGFDGPIQRWELAQLTEGRATGADDFEDEGAERDYFGPGDVRNSA